MKATVGERGQVTIPKRIRDRLGIRAGERLEFEELEAGFLARKATAEERVAAVYGIIELPASVDELIDEMRGPAVLPQKEARPTR